MWWHEKGKERNEECILANVDSGDTNTAKVLNAFDHFVEDFASVGFEASGHLDGVSPSFRIFA
jgi:hypothetical protein